jgi:O-antigen/teichoic acid export membrane protein
MGALDDGSMAMSERRDIVAAVARHALSVGAGVLTIAMLGRGLGRAALGAWALIGTSATVIALADLGLSTVALKQSVVDEEGAVSARAVELSQWVTLALAPVFVALSYIVYLSGLEGVVATSVASGRALKVASIAALAAGTVGSYSSAQRAWLVGRGASRALAGARASAAFVQVAVTATGLALGWGIVAPAMGVLGSSVIEATLVARAVRAMDPRVPLWVRTRPKRAELALALREGAAALAINAASVIAVRVDVAVLARVAPLAAVGAYQVSLRLSDQLFTLVKQASTALQHRLGTSEGRADVITRGTISMTALLASALIALVFCGRPSLRAWAGPVVDDALFVPALSLTGFAMVLGIWCELANSALNVGAKSQWQAATPHLIGAVFNAVITLAGARPLGVWAIAGGTIVGNAVTALLTFRTLRSLDATGAYSDLSPHRWIAVPALVSLVIALSLAPLSRSVLGSLLSSSIAGLGALFALRLVLRHLHRQEAACTSLSLLPR